MAADDLSLLFRLRGDAAGLKTATAEGRAAVSQLKNAFGPELASSVGIGQKALQSIGGSVEDFVSRQLPLLGNVAASVSSGLQRVAVDAAKSKVSIDGVGLSLAEIGAATGRTEAQVAGFIASLGLLKTEAARNTAVVGFLGGALASSLRPQLDEAAKAGAELNKIFQASGKSTDEALRLVQTLGLIGDTTQRSAAAVAFFGEATAKKLLPQLERFGASLGVIAAASGRSGVEVTEFVARFARLGTEVEKRTAAIEFFGASLATKLGPELTKTSAALAGVSAESAVAGSAVAGMAGPIGIAVLAVAALAAGVAVATKEIFELTKNAATFQSHLGDLAQQTGLAVETLSAFEVLSKRTGGNLGSITQAVTLFQRKLDDAQNPLSETAELFRKFNIETSDTETSLRSAFSALAAMPEGFAQTNAAAELFGARGGRQVLSILKETKGDLDAAITRFRELGILVSEDAARAADKLTDDLVLLEFQLRALTAVAAEDLIPAVAEMVRATGDLVQAVRPLISALGTVAGISARAAASSLKGLALVVQALTFDYKGLAKAIKEAREAHDIKPITIPELTPVPLPGTPTPRQSATEAANQAAAVVSAVKRSVAETNQALSELFQQGRRNRDQQADETIAGNKKILDAERDRIDAEITLKQQEIKALDEAQRNRGEIIRRDTDDYRAVVKQIEKLQQERLDKEGEFRVTSAAIRAKAAKENADATRNQVQNETDILTSEFDRQIKVIEARIARGATVEEAGLTVIEQLEQARADERVRGLQRQRDIGFLTIQEQEDLDAELQKLNQERDRLGDEQAARRLFRERRNAERTRDIQLASLDVLLEIEGIRAEQVIAANEALAEARVQSEEQAARKILAIRLRLIDAEIEATRARLQAAASIASVDERVRTEAELNNRLRVLAAQRTAIQDQGNRDIDGARQKDIENERQYQEELEETREDALRAERDAAEEVIRLMVASFARRRDIIRAERDLELLREEDRHRRETERINQQKRDVDEEIRLLERRLARLKIGTTEEIEEHGRLIESLEKLRAKRAELDAEQKAEDKRTQTRKRRVTVEIDFELADPDTGLQDLFDDIGQAVTDLGGKFAELIGLGAEFSAVSAQIAQQIGGTLAGAFGQFANALGQTVANWVLLGETGPAVMRKILAQALASLAAEATVQAVKELALGFATLFFNPAESAGHFVAAGLWASIAGGSALGGRALAGNLFKKPEDERDRGRSGGGSTGRDEPRPIDLIREQLKQELHIFVHGEPGGRFNEAVIVASIDDVRSNGPLRTTIKEAGKD